MSVEHVACPRCGEEALATVPNGQRLICIGTQNKPGPRRRGADYFSTCRCRNCENFFFAFTADIDRTLHLHHETLE